MELKIGRKNNELVRITTEKRKLYLFNKQT